MKRMLFGTILAALIGVAGFSFADAQEQAGRRPGGGPGFGGRGPGGPGGFARLVDLTEEQRKAVRAIVDEERASRQGATAPMTLHRQLEAELLADAPDEQKLDTLRRQIVEAQGEALTRQIGLQRKIAQVLTPEQRAQARERLAAAPRGRAEAKQSNPSSF